MFGVLLLHIIPHNSLRGGRPPFSLWLTETRTMEEQRYSEATRQIHSKVCSWETFYILPFSTSILTTNLALQLNKFILPKLQSKALPIFRLLYRQSAFRKLRWKQTAGWPSRKQERITPKTEKKQLQTSLLLKRSARMLHEPVFAKMAPILTLKHQRMWLKGFFFFGGKDVFALLLAGFGKSLVRR